MRTIADFNSNVSWYVGYYFSVMIIAGLFLNGILEKIDKKQYKNILLVLFGIVSIGWTGGVLENLARGLKSVKYILNGYSTFTTHDLPPLGSSKGLRMPRRVLLLTCRYTSVERGST